MLYSIDATLTDGGEDIGEAEVVHSIKGQKMVEKLLFLIITAQEGVSLVQFSKNKIGLRKTYNFCNDMIKDFLLKWKKFPQRNSSKRIIKFALLGRGTHNVRSSRQTDISLTQFTTHINYEEGCELFTQQWTKV